MSDNETTPAAAGVNEEERARVEAEAEPLVLQARAMVVEDAESFEAAGDFLTTAIKAWLAKSAATFNPIEEKQKATVSAAKDALAETRRQRKTVEQPVLDAELVVKGTMADWHDAQERAKERLQARIRQRAKERLQKAADAGEDPVAAATTAPAPLSTPKPQAAGVAAARVWKYEVLNPGELKPGFVAAAKGKIRPVVVAMGADAVAAVSRGSTPAIRVWQETQISAGAR